MTLFSPEAMQQVFREANTGLNDPSSTPYEVMAAKYLDQEEAAGRLAVAGGTLDNDPIGDILKRRQQNTETSGVTLPNLDPNFRSLLETSHTASSELFQALDFTPPELTAFSEVGVDLAKLQTAHETMMQSDLAPEIVIAPILSVEQWKQLYKGLEDDQTINQDGRIKDGGLYIDDTVANHWDELMQQTIDNAHTVQDDQGIAWHILVMPGTDRPPVLKVGHNGTNVQNQRDTTLQQQIDSIFGQFATVLEDIPLHPSTPAYLTLQAARLQANTPPLDNNTRTWLQGTFTENNSLRAPGGRWSPGNGRVDVRWFEVGDRRDYLGVRLPVWG